MKNKKLILITLAVILGGSGYLLYPSRDTHVESDHGEHGHGEKAEEEFERGPNNGRLLKKDDFAVEITIFEDGVPPQFRVFAYENNKPIDPSKVQLTMELKRLDGEVNSFNFVPKDAALMGDATVTEPHSFDVKVKAVYDGKPYEWAFASYEGRTLISKESAELSGVKTQLAGPATIRETITLTGRLALNPNATAHVKARFAGVIRSVKKSLGDTVKAGEVLATVESNESLQVYAVPSPINGVVLARHANTGEAIAADELFAISDLSKVWAEFHVFQRDIEKVKIGQKVLVRGVEGKMQSIGVIDSLLPIAETSSQTVVARVIIDNPQGNWRSGMTVLGDVVINERTVPLAVTSSALQRFRDFTVVFAQVGETYEVRMLELGTNDGEWVEVLGGIKPGTPYVSENSFLIRADIEKSGASHDH
ncbi:MAG: HlyD family efflux transporter periplasmic adaptor subunit [Alphaproteobacteria bacterium]|nr:MAG: HlyD family efflux transporter periplasmic adaptor subunit [Alphaproteobacteria bacterium]TAF40071.1 MAG: HlyD family efflux transporter periplasmic adaptor subunit [Alphaproteobacteria bacterium]TAF74810.1 MAG: HlyD family efflux transporter periplasmic adaptor subunit [Alphaproteobacteria bacterium]